jgi:hypothetical protein
MSKMSELDMDRQSVERLTDVVPPPPFAARARVELKDIDLRAGFHAMRWFWLAFAILVTAWAWS